MRALYLFFAVMTLAATVIIFDMIWTRQIPPATAWKLLLTIGLFSGLVGGVYILRNEFLEEKKQKKDKYID